MAYDATYLMENEASTTGDSHAETALPWRKANRRRDEPPRRIPEKTRRQAPARRGPSRAAREGREEFRCRHCRSLIGPTITGGRHRNHCPLCLHSRHVDDRRPGDRASDCGASMAPIAQFARANGEPVIVHRCLGCGLERHNRVAADDNTLLLTRLPLVQPRTGRPADADGQAMATEEREAS
jgi:hypothetical protein